VAPSATGTAAPGQFVPTLQAAGVMKTTRAVLALQPVIASLAVAALLAETVALQALAVRVRLAAQARRLAVVHQAAAPVLQVVRAHLAALPVRPAVPRAVALQAVAAVPNNVSGIRTIHGHCVQGKPAAGAMRMVRVV
jgi:hypothetical protein